MINIILSSLFDTDKVVLYRQKIKSTSTLASAPCHYEVLCKFLDRHNKVPLPPGDFIETLERHDLQIELDRYIVIRALKWILLNDPLGKDIYHINISPKSIKMLPQLLDRYTADIYSRISFEVTENSLIDLSLNSIAKLNYIRGLGIGISFDDFGSKYVSYSEVKLVRPDYIKIDGSYVRTALIDKFDATVVQNIIALAKAVDAYTIAEAVENQDIADHMTSMGVDFLQGWHIGQLEELSFDQ